MIEPLSRRALILFGKGGAGKTAISTALATTFAQAGQRVLLMECDAHQPIATMFGCARGLDPIEAAPGVWLMLLEGRHSLEEYLRLVLPGRAILNVVFASSLYQYFVQAAPGLRELMMLGKVYYEVEQSPEARRKWQCVIVDAPASGQAINLLRMPLAARESFGDSVVGREAQAITRMLQNQGRCSIVLVATPDPLSLAETLESNAALTGVGLKVAAVILNRRNPAAFSSEDVTRLARNSTLRRSLRTMDHLCELARAEIERAAVSRRALAQLQERIGCPVIELAEHRGRSGLELVRTLAAELSSRRDSPVTTDAAPLI